MSWTLKKTLGKNRNDQNQHQATPRFRRDETPDEIIEEFDRWSISSCHEHIPTNKTPSTAREQIAAEIGAGSLKFLHICIKLKKIDMFMMFTHCIWQGEGQDSKVEKHLTLSILTKGLPA